MPDSNARNADLSRLKIDRSKRADAPRRWTRWFHLLWLLVPVAAYIIYSTAVERVTPTIQVRLATVAFLTQQESSADLVATGYVVAQIKADVASKGTGRLKILNVEEGDRVARGDTLAELENDDFRAELDLAEANLKLAMADSTATGLNYRRFERLHSQNLVSQEDYEIATAAYAKALASIQAAEARVRAAQVAVDNTIITAPFDGTVLTKFADVGEMVAPFASAASSRGAVVTLADMNSLEVEADVAESNIHKVKINQPCRIVLDAYQNLVYTGYVKKVVPTADRARATVMTKIAFDSLDARVLPEMSARVTFMPIDDAFADTTQPALVVPREAVTSRDGQTVAFVVGSDFTVTPVKIQTGRELGSVTEIISGLSAGQRVVLSPPGRLVAGDKVEPAT